MFTDSPFPLWLILAWQAIILLGGAAFWHYCGYQTGYDDGTRQARDDAYNLINNRARYLDNNDVRKFAKKSER